MGLEVATDSIEVAESSRSYINAVGGSLAESAAHRSFSFDGQVAHLCEPAASVLGLQLPSSSAEQELLPTANQQSAHMKQNQSKAKGKQECPQPAVACAEGAL